MQEDMKIPVVFATDRNYLFFTCVAITSMAHSAKANTLYQIYILTDQAFTDEDHLLDKIQEKYSNIKIKIMLIDDRIFQGVIINNSHVTKVTFYRLVLCDVLPEEKCLYLDSDTLITEDLTELYETRIEDHYIAGCRDIWIDLLGEREKEERRQKTGIPSMDQYVNAGVILFNLKKLREDKIDNRFKEHLNIDHPYEDQDILNVCCYNQILLLPAKWNLFTLFMGQLHRLQKAGFQQEVLNAFAWRKGIIHYATPYIRPWERESCWANEEWWQTAQIWEKEPDYQQIRQKTTDNEWKNSWEFYIKECSFYSTIVIFGFSKYGEELSEWIQKIKDVEYIIFCDNDREKQGKSFQGIPVKSFEDIEYHKKGESFLDTLFIIASQRKAGQIQEFLLQQGLQKGQIIRYKHKNAEYYSYLDSRYYRNEFQDICKKEGTNEFSALTLKEVQEKLLEDNRYHTWIDKYFMKEWLLKEYRNDA